MTGRRGADRLRAGRAARGAAPAATSTTSGRAAPGTGGAGPLRAAGPARGRRPQGGEPPPGPRSSGPPSWPPPSTPPGPSCGPRRAWSPSCGPSGARAAVEAQLRVPYRDTAADELVWRLGEPRRPALATLDLEVAGGGSSCGCSAAPTRSSSPLRRAVAGRRVRGRGLRDWALRASRRPPNGWWTAGTYEFRAVTHRLPPARFGPRVDGLVARLAGHPAAIVGRFPGFAPCGHGPAGRPRPRRAGVRWRTWHAYPQDGRLVSTATTVRPR